MPDNSEAREADHLVKRYRPLGIKALTAAFSVAALPLQTSRQREQVSVLKTSSEAALDTNGDATSE